MMILAGVTVANMIIDNGIIEKAIKVKDETQKRKLGHMGYMLGRFIYILDAYEDMEKDKKKK